jgi:uncharacterized membrane protein YgcG
MRIASLSVPVIVLTLFCASQSALAQINDNAKLFSDTAKQEAEKSIQQMRDKFKHTLLIETFPKIPADKQAKYDPEKKAQFFEEWATERGKALGVNGVVLLVCMEPRHFVFVAGNKTQESGLFTKEDIQGMLPRIREALAKKDYDQVATNGAASVLERMTRNDANRPNRVEKPATRSLSPIR